MSKDDDGEDDASGRVPPPPPDDRLWRHPSEVSSFGRGRLSAPPSPSLAPSGRTPVWPIAVVAALVGAVLCGGVLAVTGHLSVDPERVIERVKVTPNVPALGLPYYNCRRREGPGQPRGGPPPHDGPRRRFAGLRCGRARRRDRPHERPRDRRCHRDTLVELVDGRQVEGTMVGADLPTDVGVITIEARGLSVVVLGSSEDLDVVLPRRATASPVKASRQCRPA